MSWKIKRGADISRHETWALEGQRPWWEEASSLELHPAWPHRFLRAVHPSTPAVQRVTASSRTALPGQERHEPGGVPQGGSRSARSHSRDQKAQGTDEQRSACQGGEEQAGPLAGSPSVTWLCLKSKAGASDAASSVLLLSTAPWQLQTAARTGPSSKNNP